MKFVINQSFFNFDKNGNAKKQPVGKEISQKEYDSLTPLKQQKCTPKEYLYGAPWAYEEDALAGYAYHERMDAVNNEGETELVEYLSQHLDRPASSLHLKIAQIKKGDTIYGLNNKPVEGMSYSKQIAEIMIGIDPNRYVFN